MSARLKLTALISVVFVLAMAFAIIPSFAQDTPSDTELTIVTGAVEFTATGDIMVAGVIIAPASGFNPSTLQPGDIVIVTGVLNPSGVLQAISLEFFDDDEPEVTPEPTAEVTPEATLEVTPELTPEATLVVTPEVTAGPDSCVVPGHPVAQAIANTFGVPYDEVMGLHCAGNGFGNIVRAYTLAQTAGGTAQEYIDRHHAGEGWGNIRKLSGVDPSELAPGRVLKPCKQGECETVEPNPDATPAAQMNPGNGNGNGNGNGGGNGNGNGNGGKKDKGNRGNGGGNGNAGGNGNGNGGGNGGGRGK